MIDSGIGEFVQQLPSAFIVIFCGSGLALIAAVVLIVNARVRRANAANTTSPSSFAAPVAPVMNAFSTSEMPDLDSLLRSEAGSAPVRSVKTGTYSVVLDDDAAAEAVEVLTVMRDVAGGGLIVQLGDKTRRISKNMEDAEFRQKLAAILKEIAGTMGAPASAPTANAAKPQPQMPVAAESVPVAADTIAASAEPKPEPAVVSEQNVSDSAPRLTAAPRARSASFDLPTYTLDTPTPNSRRDLKRAIEQPVPELDIAGRIESFLQHKLATTDTFSGHVLHILPADDGIRIQVDDVFYDAVSDVQDAAVRTFLQQTIQEWQDRQS